MNYEAAIFYAKQQMQKTGKSTEQYRIEPVRVSCNASENEAGHFQIRAYNELYILVNPEKYFGLLILSDNSAFNSDAPIQSGVPEFTGVIQFIRIGESWNLQSSVAAPPPVTGEYDGGAGTGEVTKGGGTTIPVEFLRVVIY